MKSTAFLLLTCLSLIPTTNRAAQTASARMYSTSILMHEARNAYDDLIDVNYAGRPESADEFGIVWHVVLPADIELPGPTDYFAYMSIWDDFYQYSSQGTFYLSLPPLTDGNNNRFPDFFEVSRAVSSQVSSGVCYYQDPFLGPQTFNLTANWSRTAGSKSGTCRIIFSGNYWGTFTNTFEIVEYTGTVSYTPGADSVSASVNLTQTGSPANTWRGPIRFLKAEADRFNTLTNDPGTWTNAASATFNFNPHYFFRNPSYPTNYAGYIEFDDDGDPSTLAPWAYWVLSINDTNDSNHNGIPDFSDDASGLPRRPQLALASGATNLLLTIHGDVGHLHQVQSVASLTSSNWQNVVSVTLTNDPQVVPLAKPAGPTYWRVWAQ